MIYQGIIIVPLVTAHYWMFCNRGVDAIMVYADDDDDQ
jgi:hypothetical protein